jgi:hypothetical protein
VRTGLLRQAPTLTVTTRQDPRVVVALDAFGAFLGVFEGDPRDVLQVMADRREGEVRLIHMTPERTGVKK